MFQAQSRFGASVAVVDINLDGADDIAVGAPALGLAGEDPLLYHVHSLIIGYTDLITWIEETLVLLLH